MKLEDIYSMAIDSFSDMTEEEIEAYFKEANADPEKFLENLVEGSEEILDDDNA